jgi:hypothetical protein
MILGQVGRRVSDDLAFLAPLLTMGNSLRPRCGGSVDAQAKQPEAAPPAYHGADRFLGAGTSKFLDHMSAQSASRAKQGNSYSIRID